MGRLREDLIPKIKQFFILEGDAAPATAALSPSTQGKPSPAKPLVKSSPAPWRERKVLAIGVSTGGPTALAEIVPMFPASFPLPIVMVQHMPPFFTRLLAERLQSKSQLRILEAEEGSVAKAGTLLIAPGNYHMRMVRHGSEMRATLDQAPPENSCRPAVDVLFRSVSENWGGATVGVILTGMGQDGLRGVEQLKADGAYIIAQDQPSSVVWGMPGAVTDAGLADAVLDLKAIVPEILRQVR
jgi:two-component system chemotaxis response regulator CheB